MSVAIIFPGQGSQQLGMLAELADEFPQVRETFQEASDVLGEDLWSLAQTGPEAELNRTEHTQVVMLTADVAVWRVWQAKQGCLPVAMAGHSLGEYAALVCANAMRFDDALKLVRQRARHMQAAVTAGEGAMAAILGLAEAQVEAACEQASDTGVVMAANYNAPGQVVIAGQAAAVEQAVSLAKAQGAKRAVPLAVSVPSHCQLMRPAAARLAEDLASVAIAAPTIPVIHNADVAAYQTGGEIRDALIRQLYQPVRWVATVNALTTHGAHACVEAGPGKVLTGLNRRIARQMPCVGVDDIVSLDEALRLCEGG